MASSFRLLWRTPIFPQNNDPMTLNNPMVDSAQAPRIGSKLLSLRNLGRWVAMKVMWKPQTANPQNSNQKRGWRAAMLKAWMGPVACPAEGAVSAFPASRALSGMVINATIPRAIRAPDHPKLVINTCPRGTSTNWPMEPPAEAMPRYNERFLSDVTRPTAPSTTPKPVALVPRPIKRPVENINSAGVSASDIRYNPRA